MLRRKLYTGYESGSIQQGPGCHPIFAVPQGMQDQMLHPPPQAPHFLKCVPMPHPEMFRVAGNVTRSHMIALTSIYSWVF